MVERELQRVEDEAFMTMGEELYKLNPYYTFFHKAIVGASGGAQEGISMSTTSRTALLRDAVPGLCTIHD